MKDMSMKWLSACCGVLLAAGVARSQTGGAASSDASHGFSGKVTETMNAGDYTYVQVDTGAKKLWAAAPRFPIKVGDTVSIKAGMPMEKYHSKILNKDFDVVYFTDRVGVNGEAAGAADQIPELPKNHPPIPGNTTKPNFDLSGIKKAQGGKTIAEIYAGKEQLKGKTVTVRGKVVKYNPHIMDRNWVHLRDGTGAEGSNDLLVTTSSDLKLGDTVVATGVVAVNKDFGANYKYSVMLENTKVKVE
jgi:ribosomal protein S17